VDLIADVAAQGKLGYYWTKAWVPLSEAQRSQWLRYTLSSFLLAAGSKSFFNFDSVNEPVPAGRGNNANAAEYYAEYDRVRQLGLAIDAAMNQVPGTGVFERRWEHGLVLVNPTAKPAQISVPGQWTDLDGQAVREDLTVPAHSGQVLSSKP
jgi:hypothetical protein